MLFPDPAVTNPDVGRSQTAQGQVWPGWSSERSRPGTLESCLWVLWDSSGRLGRGRSKCFQGCGSLQGGPVKHGHPAIHPEQCADGGPLLWMYVSDPRYTQHAYIRVRSQEVGEGKERLVDSLEGKHEIQRARVWSGNVSRFPGAGP